jgi:hypothetical protein
MACRTFAALVSNSLELDRLHVAPRKSAGALIRAIFLQATPRFIVRTDFLPLIEIKNGY